MAELIDVIPVRNTLGEGVLWDGLTRRLWWTDIQEKHLHRYDPATKHVETLDLPERLGSFGFVQGGHRLIAAFESGIALFDPETRACEWLFRPEPREAGVRFNDGRVDRQGRFWAGTMVEGGPGQNGKLYCVDRMGRVQQRAGGIGISNGIAWSPDSSRFYFADSTLGTIFAYGFHAASGAITGRRVFAKTPEGVSPDGANVDRDGFLWSAQWGASRVVRYAPDGGMDGEIAVPAQQPTCIAFGGANLDLLFVTSAREGLNSGTLMAQPDAGSIFVFKVSTPGLPDGRFIDERP